MPAVHYSPVDDHSDAVLLDLLTGPTPPAAKKMLPRRDSALDPLLIAAAAASGPHVTRNHYHHDFFPGVMLPQSEGSWDWTRFTGEDVSTKAESRRLTYVSRQAPRRQRLQGNPTQKENDSPLDVDTPLRSANNLPHTPKLRRASLISLTDAESKTRSKAGAATQEPSNQQTAQPQVKCMARTRIPTAHGPVFLHLYHNTRDNKEHLAIVVDPAQFSDSPSLAPPIRSQSLDAVWSDSETEMDRITRGAYVGKLTPTKHHASKPVETPAITNPSIPAPLIRLHSECFTGETVGSMRCDCGEQLDEAIRLMSQPITIPSSDGLVTVPGRGVVVYLRQEGRGIGLLSKIRAYNLQDLGHDTVTANLMLGHKADERGYEIAGSILRDLGLGVDADLGEGVRVLTNNPDKVQALEKEGLRVVERVSMVPRSWQSRNPHLALTKESIDVAPVGSTTVYGEDLDKYLRTKVLKMGHMLPLWMEDPQQ